MKPKLAPFQLASHMISSVVFEVKDEFGNVELRPDFSIEPEYEILQGEDVLQGSLSLDVAFKLRKGRRILIRFECTAKGFFTAHKTITRDHFVRFLKHSGTPILLQIVRSFLISLSSQAGLTPPLLIPLVDSTKLYDTSKE